MNDVERFLKYVEDSAPGKDGIPFSGWRFSGKAGVETIWMALWWLLDGYFLHLDFNYALTEFVLKKQVAEDKVFAKRAPAETRPIGLKDCDNKAIGGIVNQCFRFAAASGLSPLQRGFIYGRNPLQNVVELDAFAREAALSGPQLLPILGTFDFGTVRNKSTKDNTYYETF